MCEPAYSIIQYPDDDVKKDDDSRFGDHMTVRSRLSSALGNKIADLGRKIKSWFHYSKVACGHSQAIMLSGRSTLYLPQPTYYEGLWWDREFVRDGTYYGFDVDSDLAFECAKEYNDTTVMASMSAFRRFLEESIIKSSYSIRYVERLVEDTLNQNGRNAVIAKLRRIFGGSSGAVLSDCFGYRVSPEKKLQATSVVMGFTRKRKLFLPHWADNDRLW